MARRQRRWMEATLELEMSFVDHRYLTWFVPKLHSGAARFNLASSGVAAVDLGQLSLPGGPRFQAQPHGFEGALARWLGVGEGELIFAPGATGGTLLATLSLTPQGSTILVEAPIYEPMLLQPSRTNKVRRFVRTFEGRWQLPLDAIAAMMGDEVAMVSITEPGNPGGLHSRREDVLALADMAAEHGAILLINEVYQPLSGHTSYHGLRDNIVVVSSLSKVFGAYQHRLGWLSASPEIIGRLRLGHMAMGMPTLLAADVGTLLVEDAPQRIQSAKDEVARGLPVVEEWVEATDAISWHTPEGPGFGAVLLPDGMDDVAVADKAFDDHGILLVPGTFFDAPGTIRICWHQIGDELAEGLDHLATVLGTI